MEIERKFIIIENDIPFDFRQYPCHYIEQGYLCTKPVIRIRQDNDRYELTYKSSGLMVREEHNLPLAKSSYEHLKQKIDGNLIRKERYVIPLEHPLVIELDVFLGTHAPLILAEVEFPDVTQANSFIPPAWFGKEVTHSPEYHNSNMV